MDRSQPIRFSPDDDRIMVRPRWRRSDDYSVKEKAAIARLAVTPDVRTECPRCEDHPELKGAPVVGGGTIEVVWDFQCPGCHRRVLLTRLPDGISKAS